MCASWWMRISLATTMAGDCHSYYFFNSFGSYKFILYLCNVKPTVDQGTLILN
jgi:hypothetical protein